MLLFHASGINHKAFKRDTSKLRSLCRSRLANNIATEQQQAGNEAARAVKVAVVSRDEAMASTHGRRLINRMFKNFPCRELESLNWPPRKRDILLHRFEDD